MLNSNTNQAISPDKVCENLRKILVRHPTIYNEPKICENLLHDLCVGHNPEVFVLVTALRAGIVNHLLSNRNSTFTNMVIDNMVRLLQKDYQIDSVAARWAVNCWAIAIGKGNHGSPVTKTSSPSPVPKTSSPSPVPVPKTSSPSPVPVPKTSSPSPVPKPSSPSPVLKNIPKKPLNKWIIILPVILVVIIAIAAAITVNLQQPSPPISTTQQNQMTSTTQQFLTYNSNTYGVTMQYPSDWIKNETMTGDEFVIFDSPQAEGGHYIAEIQIGTYNSSTSSLTDILNNLTYNYRNSDSLQNFTTTDYNQNSTLAGQSAYRLVSTATDSYSGIAYTYIDTGIIVDSKVYYIHALVNSGQYFNYISIIRQMINSFTITTSGY